MPSYSNVNAIPVMTSNTTPRGRVFASSEYSSGRSARTAFDGLNNNGWLTTDGTGGNGFIGYEFETACYIWKYTITSGNATNQAPRNWTFEGSNNNTNWTILDTRTGISFPAIYREQEYIIAGSNIGKYKTYRLRFTANNGDTLKSGLGELRMFEAIFYEKYLILNESQYQYYSNNQWNSLITAPTEQDYIAYGMNTIATAAWAKLYSDTENSSGNIDVLYYTDDPAKTSLELNLTANYSPLDELNGDYELVTWSDNNNSKSVSTSAVPSAQLITQTEAFQFYGDIASIVNTLTSSNGVLRYVLSFDGGMTWESYKQNAWTTIDITNPLNVKLYGMSQNEISFIDATGFVDKGNEIRFAYYIEDNIHNSTDGTKIDSVKINVNSTTDTIKMSDIAFYVLNTNATIQLSLSSNKLTGSLDDSDQGKVQYRVMLNNKPYFPFDGNFTPLAPSPQDISINISERDILFNQENVLRVEFKDYWGETDYWETTFIGDYSGLMFMDETGEYLSDTFGGILKYLNFGTLFAGQTTVDQRVIIKNQLGYPIDELFLEVNKEKLPSGVGVELSRLQTPFLPVDYITYELTGIDETNEFFVRLTSDVEAEPVPNGIFELKIKAKKHNG